MLKFTDIPISKLKEQSNNNKLCNYYSNNFKSRFGDVVKPVHINKIINSNEFKKLEKKNIVSFINKLNKSNIIKKNIIKFKHVYKYRESIYNWLIDRNKKNEINNNTLSKYIFMLGLLILYNKPFNKDNRVHANNIIQYSNIIQSISQTIKYDNNIIDISKNYKYTSFLDLLKQRAEYKKKFDSIVLYDRYNHNSHMAYLKLCMNTYIPPFRLELLRMKYKVCDTSSNDVPTTDKKETNNYLCYYDNVYYIVINHDKVVKRYGQQVYKLDNDNNYMNCTELTDILNKSFLLFPRDYIFVPFNKPSIYMNNMTYNNLISATQNMLRQAYHTYYDKEHTPRLTNKEISDMCLKMRHSVSIANRIYNKILPTNNTVINEKKNNIIEDKQKKLIEYRKEYNKKYFNKYSYGYIRASDNRYLYYLHKGKIKHPKQHILDKHGIELVDGVYKFTDTKLKERTNNKDR